MKVHSADRRSWLRIELQPDEENNYSSFVLAADVDCGHSKFTSENRDLHLFGLAEFILELNKFVLNRSRTPILVGTYDSHVCFRALGSAVILDFCIGSFQSYHNGLNHSHRGAFEIDQEFLNQIVEGFDELNAQK